ncbi:MAG TPA: ADP-ribosylglycohydrolase family protein [Cytophagales bacterium]
MKEQLLGCLVGGGIGDAIGGFYENRAATGVDLLAHAWHTSDDTQLTLATCQAMVEAGGKVVPAAIARTFLEWYNAGRLTGLGASTLKALRDLQVGAHWALAGRTGERAAGNGAAMRIAPLAFKVDLTWERHLVRDVVNITHKNDEAYAGALAVVVAVQQALGKHWTAENDLLPLVIDHLPDTRVRDRLIELQGLEGQSVLEVGKQYGSSGYVVESVPLALYAAGQITNQPVAELFAALVEVGGDTDTVCSMTGQIIGTRFGPNVFPAAWRAKFGRTPDMARVEAIVRQWQ